AHRQRRPRPLIVGPDHAAGKREREHRHEAAVHQAVLRSTRGGAGTGLSFRRRVRSTKNSGMKMVATNVAISMPPKTPVPIERLAAAPAPVASTSGKTPSMNASEVM